MNAKENLPNQNLSNPLSFASRISNQVKQSLRHNNGRKPQHIFHYTSIEGLSGILSSNEFWATDIRYMNDSSELEYGVDLVCCNLSKLTTVADNGYSDILNEVCTSLPEHHNFFKHIGAYYAVSFCEDGDLLSQWRSYASDGQGYALGFNTKKLLANISNTYNDRPVLRKMIYSPQKQVQLITDLVNYGKILYNEILSTSSSQDQHDWETQLILALRTGFYLLASNFKDTGFKEENEWRLVVWEVSPLLSPQNSLVFNPITRIRGSSINPYVPIRFNGSNSLDLVPLEKIICGPTLISSANYERREYAIKLFLHEKKLNNNIIIEKSKIPYVNALK